MDRRKFLSQAALGAAGFSLVPLLKPAEAKLTDPGTRYPVKPPIRDLPKPQHWWEEQDLKFHPALPYGSTLHFNELVDEIMFWPCMSGPRYTIEPDMEREEAQKFFTKMVQQDLEMLKGVCEKACREARQENDPFVWWAGPTVQSRDLDLEALPAEERIRRMVNHRDGRRGRFEFFVFVHMSKGYPWPHPLVTPQAMVDAAYWTAASLFKRPSPQIEKALASIKRQDPVFHSLVKAKLSQCFAWQNVYVHPCCDHIELHLTV